MIKKIPFYLAIVLALMLSACASIKAPDQKALLRTELGKWENFSSEGVVEASYGGFTLRKMFVLSKTRDEMRLDVVDGGAFGINPKPLVSVYLGDYVTILAPMIPQLEMLSGSLPQSNASLSILSNPDSLVSRYGDEIVATRKLTFDTIELSFSDQMRLEKITDSRSGMVFNVTYTRLGDPDKVSVAQGKSMSLNLLVDKTTYGNAEIVALPRSEANPLMEELQKALNDLLPPQGEPRP